MSDHQNPSSPDLGMAPIKQEGATVVDPAVAWWVDEIWDQRMSLEPITNKARKFAWRRKMARLTRADRLALVSKRKEYTA